jgi:ABC-type amino acid transport substrate-binding protein
LFLTAFLFFARMRGACINPTSPQSHKHREEDEDEAAMLAALRGGRIEALVLDQNLVQATAATQCDLVAVGAPFSIKDSGLGLNTALPDALVSDINV